MSLQLRKFGWQQQKMTTKTTIQKALARFAIAARSVGITAGTVLRGHKTSSRRRDAGLCSGRLALSHRGGDPAAGQLTAARETRRRHAAPVSERWFETSLWRDKRWFKASWGNKWWFGSSRVGTSVHIPCQVAQTIENRITIQTNGWGKKMQWNC